MILVHLKPYMVKIKFWDKEEVNYVLNRIFDSELIRFIEENNLQIGDNIIEKQEQKRKV